jgi:alkylation response protein AidB-like acyl-CoA dehydrogenase
MTLSFSYLGIQRAVLDYTAAALRGDGGASERRDHPQKQHGWAEMRLAWERSQALTYRVLGEVGVDPTDAQLRRAWAATVTAMETAPEVASTAVRVCGGRSLLRPSALERMYRDARCGATMLPWSVEVVLGRLGRAELYDD